MNRTIWLVLFLLVGALSTPVAAQPQIRVTPANPLSTDSIRITVETRRPCYPDGPNDYIVTNVIGSTVRITARLTCISFTPPPFLVITEHVGHLPPGAYQIEYWSSSGSQAPQLQAQLPFDVAEGQPIPATSTHSLIALVVVILLVVWRVGRTSASLLIITIAAAVTVSSLASSRTAEAQSTDVIAEGVQRQLVVLFDFSRTEVPRPDDIVNAVKHPDTHSTLVSSLGSPSDAHRLLAKLDTSLAARSVLELNPHTPRAILEQYVVLTYQTEANAIAAMRALESDQSILSVERNGLYEFSAVPPINPSDTYFAFSPARPYAGAFQWGMTLLNLPRAWDRVQGTAYVAALDNGIYCASNAPCVSHIDIQSNFRSHFSINVGSGGSTNLDEYTRFGLYRGHGTHVAGIIAAASNNNAGVSGLCWNCSLSVLKFELTYDQTATALTFAVDHGVQAVNLSFGDYYDSPRFSSCADAPYALMCQAIAHATARDVVLVAASGNGTENRIEFPASHQHTIAVGGVQYGGSFWTSGYGNPGPCPTTPPDECGSNFGTQLDGSPQVVGPALDVVSTFYPGAQWSPNVHCVDTWGPTAGVLASGYGDCTGTSQATPYVTGVIALLRSVNPLASRSSLKTTLFTNTVPCTPNDARCGAGIPDAAKAVTATLGSLAARNRLTPLFSFFSREGNDHFYTVVPQMALAALHVGQLLPQPPPPAAISYVPLGDGVPGYVQFPIPPNCFSPCPSSATPLAMVSVFTTHVDPTSATAELVPLYRMSWKCNGSCSHVSHSYTTEQAGVEAFKQMGYVLDGIEGYVFPHSKSPQPIGTVKLCRKYSEARDDYVLFAGTGPNGGTCGTSDGFTRDANGNLLVDYTVSAGGTDYIGYVYPVRAPQAVNGTPILSVLSLMALD